MQRSDTILACRPTLDLESTAEQTTEEQFQNTTLRPILKLQHELLIARFSNDPLTMKAKLKAMQLQASQQYITDRIKKDSKLQRELLGMVTGLFTLSEYEQYWPLRAELNRRLLTMLSKRIMSHYHDN